MLDTTEIFHLLVFGSFYYTSADTYHYWTIAKMIWKKGFSSDFPFSNSS